MIDTFNRFVVVLLGLGLLVAATVVVLVASGLLPPDRVLAAGPLEASLLQPTIGFDRVIVVAAATAIGLLALLLLYVELRAGRRDTSRLVLHEDKAGSVTINLGSIRQLATHEAAQVDGVLRADSRVRTTNHGLRIHSMVSVSPSAKVTELGSEIGHRIRSSVEGHLGCLVQDVRIDTQLVPNNSRARIARRLH